MSAVLEFPPIEAEVTPPAQDLAPIAKAALDLAKVNLTDVALAQFGDWRRDVADATKKLTGVQHDLSTQAKIDEAKSLRQRLINAPLAERRKVSKALKSKLNTVSAEVGAELVLIEAGFADVAKLITPQIEAREAEIAEEKRIAAEKEAARVAAIQTKIDAIRACVAKANQPDMTSERIQRGIDQVEAIEISKDVFEDLVDEAAQAKSSTLAAMLNLRDAAKAREDEEARLEELRINRERIAAELTAAAEKLAAERAEFERQQAEFKAKQDAAAKAAADQDKATAARVLEQSMVDLTDPASVAQMASEILAATEQNSQEQTLQHVVKATEETPEATDRSESAITSPSVGSMGAGQASDEAPVAGTVHVLRPAKQPTLTLGAIKERLGFVVTADYLAGLGFHAVTVKAAKLYQEEDWPRICDAICASVQQAKSREEVAA